MIQIPDSNDDGTFPNQPLALPAPNDNGTNVPPSHKPGQRRAPYKVRPGRRLTLESFFDSLQPTARHAYETFLVYVQAGGVSESACRLLGISTRTFHRWFAIGESEQYNYERWSEDIEYQVATGQLTEEEADLFTPPTLSAYWQFWRDVCDAKTKARTIAESKVYRDNPLTWLRNQAREKEGVPGWTDKQKVELSLANQSGSLIDDDERSLSEDPRVPQEVRAKMKKTVIEESVSLTENPNIQDLAATLEVLEEIGVFSSVRDEDGPMEYDGEDYDPDDDETEYYSK